MISSGKRKARSIILGNNESKNALFSAPVIICGDKMNINQLQRRDLIDQKANFIYCIYIQV